MILELAISIPARLQRRWLKSKSKRKSKSESKSKLLFSVESTWEIRVESPKNINNKEYNDIDLFLQPGPQKYQLRLSHPCCGHPVLVAPFHRITLEKTWRNHHPDPHGVWHSSYHSRTHVRGVPQSGALGQGLPVVKHSGSSLGVSVTGRRKGFPNRAYVVEFYLESQFPFRWMRGKFRLNPCSCLMRKVASSFMCVEASKWRRSGVFQPGRNVVLIKSRRNVRKTVSRLQFMHVSLFRKLDEILNGGNRNLWGTLWPTSGSSAEACVSPMAVHLALFDTHTTTTHTHYMWFWNQSWSERRDKVTLHVSWWHGVTHLLSAVQVNLCCKLSVHYHSYCMIFVVSIFMLVYIVFAIVLVYSLIHNCFQVIVLLGPESVHWAYCKLQPATHQLTLELNQLIA